MSESLNRAFIKAYDKEKAGEAKRKARAAELESKQVSDLIMRFDTASVTIPSPHLFTKKPAAEPISVRVITPESQNTTTNQAASAHGNLSDETLRDSIASQMLRAGGWQDQQIDAFIGGFPMVSPVHATASRETKPTRPSPVPLLEAQVVQPPAPEANETEVPESEVISSEVRKLELPNPEAPEPEANPETPNSAGPQLLEFDRVTPLDASSLHSPNEPKARFSEMPQLSAPVAPALTEPSAQQLNTAPQKPTADQSKVDVGENLESKLAQRNRDGEIFRLDRPSYTVSSQPGSTPAKPNSNSAELEHSGESAEQSSMLGELSDSVSHISVQPPKHGFRSEDVSANSAKSLPPQATPRTSVGNTLRIEKDLRKARMRVFNPVWEVDNFQWPAVCIDLLVEMTQNMSRVAKNLITACDEGLQVLAVTSPQSGEGTTTVACCLALLAGSHGLNVAIVDGDIENPTLSYQTNLDVDQDWRVAILNQLPLEEIAVHSIDDQVTLVPLLTPISPNEMATDDNRIAQMLQELSASFDLVVVDMGSMNTARNLVTSMGEQGMISAAVAVVDYRSSTPQRVEECLRRIRQAGITSVGIVENFAA
jgi:Mrp family chromosome partitioning ATPase